MRTGTKIKTTSPGQPTARLNHEEDGSLGSNMKNSETSAKQAPEASWAELLHGRNLVLSVIVTGGVILGAVDIYITATLLPSIVSDIGGMNYYAWNTTLFVVASILSAAVSGRVQGALGPRWSYFLAGALFITGCGLAAVASEMAVLLIGRVLQGAGSGMLLALCYSMIMMLFDERLWPRAIALLSCMWGVATLIGPAIGGLFAPSGNWRLAFGVQLPIAIAYIIVACLIVPPREKQATKVVKPIAFAQLILLAGSVLAISVGSTEATIRSQLSHVLAAALMLGFLVQKEKTSEVRIFPRGTFDGGNPLSLAFLTLGLLCVSENAEFFMPLFLQNLHGLSPLFAGYISVMIAVGWAAAELISARWSGTGANRALFPGTLLLLGGMASLAGLTPGNGEFDSLRVALIGVSLLVAGSGIGLAWPHLSVRIFQFSAEADSDIAASALSTAQLFAIAFGGAMTGLIVNATRFQASESGAPILAGISNSALYLFLFLCLVAVLAVASAHRLVQLSDAARVSETDSPESERQTETPYPASERSKV